MNAKKHSPLNNTDVDQVTQIFRAYKHPYRYDIIGQLLHRGGMSVNEIASRLHLETSYVSEQLDILCCSRLVFSEITEQGSVYYANEPRLAQVKKSVDTFLY